jgi:AcrR family transcriptional regulator
MNLQPAERRRLRQREDARRAILDAAEALLIEDGYERFSIRRLQERCGYTAPTIYHHFGDKRGLVDALLEERFGTLLARLRRVRLGSDREENIRQLARAFVRFALRNPTHYRLLYAPRPPGIGPPPSLETARALIQTPFRELAAGGRLWTEDFEAATQACWATLHGLIHLLTTRPEYPWSPRLFEVALETMVRGLLREPSQRDGRARARPDGRGATPGGGRSRT